jgi:ABC-2 type transport system ATP-binding protein
VCGHDVARESPRVRQLIGYLPEGVPLYPEMRAAEYLRFRARLKGIPLWRRRPAIDRVLEQAGIRDVRRRIVGTLSRGYRQRVGLADALLSEPRVLILDEPTVGLDPEQVRQFRALLREVGRERTVVLSTHILSEVELVCSSVVIIAKGRIAARDRAERLRRMAGKRACVVAEIAGPQPAVTTALQAVASALRVECEEPAGGDARTADGRYRRYRVYTAEDEDLREAVYSAVQRGGWRLRHLERVVLSLEDAFLEIVGKET